MKVLTRIMKRFAILVVMLFALYFVAYETTDTNAKTEAPCCEDCPGDGDPGNILDLCLDECNGVLFGTCYNACASAANGCYMSCVYCEQGGGGDFCTSNSECDVWGGQYCINGFCTYSTSINLCQQNPSICPQGSHCAWYQGGYFCIAD